MKFALDNIFAFDVESLTENLIFVHFSVFSDNIFVRPDLNVEIVSIFSNVYVIVSVDKLEESVIAVADCVVIPLIILRLTDVVVFGVIACDVLQVGRREIADFLVAYADIARLGSRGCGKYDNAESGATVIIICIYRQGAEIARKCETLRDRRGIAFFLFQKRKIVAVCNGDTAFDIEARDIFADYLCPIGVGCIVDNRINFFAEAFHKHVCAKSIHAGVVTA